MPGDTPARPFGPVARRLEEKRRLAELAELVRQLQARLVKAARALPEPNATVLVTGDGSGRSVLQRLETIARHWSEHVHALQAPSAA